MPFTFDSPNTFANNPLDRASHKRADAGWIALTFKAPSTLVVPFWKLRPFALRGADGRAEAGFLRPGLCESLMEPGAPLIFLGEDKGGAYFAVDISAARDPENEGPLAGLGTFPDLRGLAMTLPGGDAAILAQAKSMIDWHQRHRFCAACGAQTALSEGGYKRECGVCKAEHFPRVDPVAIMLATWQDKCLLGRGRAFPKGMFSALAGFIEPGETIEAAVRRETLEEAGIRLGRVVYHASQPWPFPYSLMIGCFGEALDEVVRRDEAELEDCRWFPREEVISMLEKRHPDGINVPPPGAIAHHLIRFWAENP